MRGGRAQPRRELRDAARERVVGFLERVGGLRARLDQRRGVREARLRGDELGPFAVAQVRARRARAARVEELALGGRAPGVDAAPRRAPAPPRAMRATRSRSPARAPRSRRTRRRARAAPRRVDSALVRVLAGDLDQPLAQRLQLRERRRRAVDPRAAASLRVEDAAQQHLAVALREPFVGEPRARPPARRRARTRRRARRARRRRGSAAARSGRRAAGRARRAGSTCPRRSRR